MALRLRRAVSLSSSLLRRTLSPISASAAAIPRRNPSLVAARHFRYSPPSLSSARSSFRNNDNSFGEDIGPDTILFEGCDYNHWLITMDFPKNPPPTREEMIETYLQTLAKVVGSYEEAKKKMYACSTTTYQGFQCLVSEEESEKFKGLPGVVFVLPDSYIDPVNKEYGGDKYDNGVITPRPPPQQYFGRQGGRYGDRNRDFNRNMRQMPNEQGNRGYDNQGPRYGDNRNFGQQQNPSVPNQQGNQGYDNQGPRYGDNRNFGQQQNPSIPNQQGNRGFDNQGPRYGDNRNFGQQQGPSVPNQQGNQGYDNQGPRYGDNSNFGQQQNPSTPNQQGDQVYDNQGRRYGDNRNFVQQQDPSPPNQQGNRGYDNQRPSYGDVRTSEQLQNPSVQPNYGPSSAGERINPLPVNNAPGGRDSTPPYQGNNYNQTKQGNFNPEGGRAQPDKRGYAGDYQNYPSPLGGVGGNYGQIDGGSEQGSGGVYRQMPGGNFGQGAGGNSSQGFHQQQMEHKNVPGEQRNYGQMGQSGTDQGRY